LLSDLDFTAVVSKFVFIVTELPGHEAVANCRTQFIKAGKPHLEESGKR
jgi:hypothetical protein